MSSLLTIIKKHKLHIQVIALLLIAIPSIGVYFSVLGGATLVTWLLMALIGAGMLLAMWVS
ncbi:MAG: hypothetical protein ACERKX_04810 [Anaerolineales bacterium]|jgi:hypothetical protein